MKRSTLIGVAVVLGAVALFFYLTTAQLGQRCEVCVEFRGRRNCATAAARTAVEATETAQRTACGPLASGMDESIACDRTPPVQVQCRTR